MSKKFLALLLAVCLTLALAAPVFAADFTDTADHWAEDSIARWAEHGIIEGIGGNAFDPDGSMTRAQAAVLFAKLLKLNTKGDLSKFDDVDPDAWYAEYIALCVGAGILNGVGDDAMDPNGTLTREQMMTMLCRALGIQPEADCDKEFADSANVSDWAEGYVNALVNAGIVDGVGDNTMAPAADINRASMMALLDKGIVAYADEEGETVTVEEGKTGIVLVVADNVKVEDAPVGTVVVTGAETSGSTVNGTEVDKDTVHEVEEEEEKPSTPSTPSTPVTPPAPPAHSHSYTYTSNNDGTHNGACECGEDAITNEDCGFLEGGNICYDCGYDRTAEAVIGTTYYATLAEAVAVGGNITLLKNVSSSAIIVIDKATVLDGNGKTLTSTAGRAINVSTANGVTIKNLTINAAGERGINVINGATNVTIDNVTIVAANYAVNAAGSATNTVITVKNSGLTGLNVVNVGAANAQITIIDSKLTCDDQTNVENYSAIALNVDAAGAQATVTGGSITVKDDSTAGSIQGAGASIAISNTTVITGDATIDEHVAIIDYNDGYWYGFTTLEAALAYAKTGETVTLLKNVELTEGLTVSAGKTVTLDLNGFDISRTVSETPDSFTFLIKNDGTLTITDSSEGEVGEICLTYGGENNSNISISTIGNYGTLNIVDGWINCVSGKQNISYAIDNISNGDATVNISGGAVYGGAAEYYCIRMFANNTTKTNSVNITDGTVWAVWLQNPNANANKAKISITGGTAYYVYISAVAGNCNCAGFDISIDGSCMEYLADYGLEYSIGMGTTSPEYKIVETDGIYTIAPVA